MTWNTLLNDVKFGSENLVIFAFEGFISEYDVFHYDDYIKRSFNCFCLSKKSTLSYSSVDLIAEMQTEARRKLWKSSKRADIGENE